MPGSCERPLTPPNAEPRQTLRGRAGQAAGLQMDVFAGDAAGIDQRERTRAEAADAVVAVAGYPGFVVDERVPGAGHRVEQRRLADIGAAHEGDERKHGRSGLK